MAQWGPWGPAGRVWVSEKNPINNRVGSGSRVLTQGSGPGIKKPGPNPTRCHSYMWECHFACPIIATKAREASLIAPGGIMLSTSNNEALIQWLIFLLGF